MARLLPFFILVVLLSLFSSNAAAQVVGVRRVATACGGPTKVGAVQVDWWSMFGLSAASPQQESQPITIHRSCEELRIGVALDQKGWDFDADIYGIGSDSANSIPILIGTIRSAATLKGPTSGNVVIEGIIPEQIAVRINVRRGPDAASSDVGAKFVIWGSPRR